MDFERNALYIVVELPREKDLYRVDFTTWSFIHCTATGVLKRYALESHRGRWVFEKYIPFTDSVEFRKKLCLIYCLALPSDGVNLELLEALCAVLDPPENTPKDWVSKRWIQKVTLAVKQRNYNSLQIPDMEEWFRYLIQQVQHGMEFRRMGAEWPPFVLHHPE